MGTSDNNSRATGEAQLKPTLDVLIEHAPMGIFLSRLSGQIVVANRAICRMTGFSAAELEKLALQNIIQAEDWPGASDFLQAIAHDTTLSEHRVLRLRKKNGETLEVRLHCALARQTADGPGLIIGQVQDLTEQNLAERKLAEDRQRLADIGRLSLLGELMGGIAHEVTQPLTAISVYADAAARLLADNKLERLEEVVHKLGEQAKRAGDIMEQVQELSRREAPRQQRSDCNELILESYPLIAPEMRMHNIHVNFALDDALPAILCDPIQVKQVILNLLRNSIDAIRLLGENTNAEIEIRTSDAGEEGRVLVSICDNGTGVSEEVAAHVFEPFSPFRKVGKGLGLGLPICRSIVQAHDGRLDFYNNGGGGATFYFSLPAG